MKKNLITTIVSMVLAYIGYLLNGQIENLNYAFCTIWGALMVVALIQIRELLEVNN